MQPGGKLKYVIPSDTEAFHRVTRQIVKAVKEKEKQCK